MEDWEIPAAYFKEPQKGAIVIVIAAVTGAALGVTAFAVAAVISGGQNGLNQIFDLRIFRSCIHRH